MDNIPSRLMQIEAFFLVAEQRDNPDEHDAGDTHQQGEHRLGLVAVLGLHAAEVGDDPEIGIVGVGNGHRARADGHDGQRGGERRGQPQRAHQGAFRRVQTQNARRRRDGHGGRALCRLEDGRDDEREEDADVGQEGRMLGDVRCPPRR